MTFSKIVRQASDRIFTPKWRKIYKDDGFHLALAIQSLGVNHVLDVGAATGQFARSIRSNGFQGKITSIEPLAASWRKLNSIQRFDSSWIIFRRCALGAKTEKLQIKVSQNYDSSSFLTVSSESLLAAPRSAQYNEETVQVYALDDIFNDLFQGHDVSLLKLDVQGFEEHVINGAVNNISRIKAALIEVSLVKLYEDQPLWLDIIGLMESLDFAPYAFFKGFCNEITGEALQLDILFVNRKFQ